MQNETPAISQQQTLTQETKADKEITNRQIFAKLTELEEKLIRIEEKLTKPLIS